MVFTIFSKFSRFILQALLEERKQKSEKHAVIQREAIQEKVKKVRESLEMEASIQQKKRAKKALKEKDQEELVDTSFIDDSGETPQIPSPTGAGDDDGIMIPLIGKKPKRSRKKKNLDPDYSSEKHKFNLDDSQSPPAPVVPPSRKRKRLQKKTKALPIKRKVRSIKISDDEDEENGNMTGKYGSSSPSSPPLVTLDNSQEGDGCGEGVPALNPVPRAYSPDITSFTGSITAGNNGNVNNDSIVDSQEDDEEVHSQTVSEKNEDDNMLYLDIFSKNGDGNGNGGEGEGEVQEGGIYDDLPPPLLTRVDEEGEYEYDSGNDSAPPVLHSYHSDNE